MEIINDIIGFFRSIPTGVTFKILGGMALFFVLRKLIKSKKVKTVVYRCGDGIGVGISSMLRAKLGKVLENSVEMFLIDVRAVIKILFDGVIDGLRKDNEKRDKCIENKDKKKAEKIEAKAKVLESKGSAIKAKKLRMKIKGRSNL